MTEFNFTVRATDNLGAFADRQFSINVRNTIIDRWVATVSGGHIIKSPDGINWTSQLNVLPNNWDATTTPQNGDVIHFSGQWYILAQTGYLTSPDAEVWTFNSYPTLSNGQTATQTYFGGRVNPTWAKSDTHLAFTVGSGAVGGGAIGRVALLMSEDGVTWEEKFFSPNTAHADMGKFTAIAYGNGHWVVLLNREVSTATFAMKSSDNGTTWTNISQTGIAAFAAKNIMFINGLWIIVNVDGSMYTSDDLEYWTYKAAPVVPSAQQRLYNWNYGNGILSVFPEIQSTAVFNSTEWKYVLSSVNLTNWTTTEIGGNPIANIASTPVGAGRSGATSSSTRVSNAFYNGSFIFGASNTYSGGTGGLYRSTNGMNYAPITNIPADVGGTAVKINGIAAISY